MIQRNRFSPLPRARFIQGPAGPRPLLAGLLISSLTVWACGGEESIGPGAPVASVEITPAAAVLVSLGETVQLTAGARDSSGRAIPGATFHWASSDDGIATVSETGLVTAVANGSVTITATTDAVEGAAAIEVAQEAAQLTFTVQPTEAIVGIRIPGEWRLLAVTSQNFTTWRRVAVSVAIEDALGNLVAGATDAVTVALGVNPSGATLEGTTTVSPRDGVAQFSPSIDRAGVGYTLVASSPGLANATSAAFDVIALNFASVSTWVDHTCGLTTTGTAYCWGDNEAGQLGVRGCFNFGFVCESFDSLVVAASTSTPVEVSGGLTFAYLTLASCGLTSTGSGYCWGGRDGPITLWRPREVPGSFTFISLSGSNFRACGITAGGTAYCWGQNTYGEVGDGTTIDRTTPVAVSGGLSFASVSVSFFNTCGVTAGGTGYCWGQNTYGQLGDGTTTDRTTPVAIAGGLDLVSVSAGDPQTCAVTSSGTAYCWGQNTYGQLGDGTTTDRTTPVPVSGGLTFASVSTSRGHGRRNYTCGIATSGTAYCWGGNNRGQLGDGTGDNSSIPVRVIGQP